MMSLRRLLEILPWLALLQGSVLPAAGEAVRTGDVRALALQARRGALEPARLQSLVALLDSRDARGLARELEAMLARGDAGLPLLHDFLAELDVLHRQTTLFTANPAMAFALIEAGARHETEVARLAHYLLAASEGGPSSPAGGPATLARHFALDLGPVLTGYHRGKFPDLEAELQHAYLLWLEGEPDNIGRILETLERLGASPPLETVERFVVQGKDYNQYGPFLSHLEKRNDEAAALVLDRAIEADRRFGEPRVEHLLLTLARMSAPAAGRAFQKYLHHPTNSQAKRAAFGAYFSVPRDPATLDLLLGYLNSGARLADLSFLLKRLAQANPALLLELKGRLDWVGLPQVKELVVRDGEMPPAGGAAAKDPKPVGGGKRLGQQD